MNPWLPGYSLDEWEKVAILGAMKFCKDNKKHAAQMLKCSVRTLDAKLEKYAKEAEEDEQREFERKERDKANLQRARGLSPQASSEGIRLQSPTQISPKQSVPVRETAQVQEVLPSQTSTSRQQRRG